MPADDEWERLRDRRQGRSRDDYEEPPANQSIVGNVVSASSKIAVGSFMNVNMASPFGTEQEGATPGLGTANSKAVPVLVLGPNLPTTGNSVICRFVDNRWVTGAGGGKKGSSPTTPTPGCGCPTLPKAISVSCTGGSTAASYNGTTCANVYFAFYQGLTLTYYAPGSPQPAGAPPYYPSTVGSPGAWYATASVTISGSAYSYSQGLYQFLCISGTYYLTVTAQNTTNGNWDAYTLWIWGAGGYSCSPFLCYGPTDNDGSQGPYVNYSQCGGKVTASG